MIVGPNGSGKTNLIEAVSLLVPGRGLRGARMAELARHGCTHWAVAARLRTGQDEIEIGTALQEMWSEVGRRARPGVGCSGSTDSRHATAARWPSACPRSG